MCGSSELLGTRIQSRSSQCMKPALRNSAVRILPRRRGIQEEVVEDGHRSSRTELVTEPKARRLLNNRRNCLRSRRTRPVAPQHASRASNINTPSPTNAGSSSSIHRTALAPVIPLPTMTVCAYLGSSSVVRWPSKKGSGSDSQKERVGLGEGRGQAGVGSPIETRNGVRTTDCSKKAVGLRQLWLNSFDDAF